MHKTQQLLLILLAKNRLQLQAPENNTQLNADGLWTHFGHSTFWVKRAVFIEMRVEFGRDSSFGSGEWLTLAE